MLNLHASVISDTKKTKSDKFCKKFSNFVTELK